MVAAFLFSIGLRPSVFGWVPWETKTVSCTAKTTELSPARDLHFLKYWPHFSPFLGDNFWQRTFCFLIDFVNLGIIFHHKVSIFADIFRVPPFKLPSSMSITIGLFNWRESIFGSFFICKSDRFSIPRVDIGE